MTSRLNCFCAALAALVLLAGTAPADIIYQHNFGGTGDLNGTAVDVGTGSWVAGPGFGASGAVADGAGQSATLAFTPVNGLIYTLDASFRNFSNTDTTTNPENDWLAIGFSNGQNTLVSNGTRFAGNAGVTSGVPVRGIAWTLVRGATTADVNNVAWLGQPGNGSPAGGNAVWSDATLAGTFGGDIDLRVVLDTTGGEGNWTATWFAKLAADSDYIEVRSSTALLNENINSVGIARANPGFTANVTSFSLTAIPEPSSLVLLGIGAITMLARRRRG